VHLTGTRKPREGIVVRGTEKKYEDTGRLDHIAFAATDVEGMRQRLQSRGVKFRESIVPRTGDTQFSRRCWRRVEFPQELNFLATIPVGHAATMHCAHCARQIATRS